jgi:hypothetical protein
MPVNAIFSIYGHSLKEVTQQFILRSRNLSQRSNVSINRSLIGINGLQPPIIQQQFDDGLCQLEVDKDDEDFGFECIPLQSVCNEEDNNDDIYFLDEYGNYVFPVSSPTIQGSCSCPPSVEELNASLRRVSQVLF